ncbi:hypothetical protein JYU29_02995 [Tianweitania sp. BSSL-BM11]|uniref:Uncharacterized protein n=1 Tax=Tianweitania aestuarii TaxID=2814886 RepID=A0ABS5RRG4_9HYPH|nr:hypothetical protein [Tianweitania aestuarii]MBS9719649.1 hypothetical protein [Tianweitania aestuarii]
MAKQKDTPSDTNAAGAVPDVPGQGDLGKIKKVDLSLHGDGISHWQDEPQDADGTSVKDKDRDEP